VINAMPSIIIASLDQNTLCKSLGIQLTSGTVRFLTMYCQKSIHGAQRTKETDQAVAMAKRNRFGVRLLR